MTRVVVAVAAVLALWAASGAAAGAVADAAVAPATNESAANDSGAPGVALAEAVGTAEASLDGEVRAASYEVRLAAADTPERRLAVLEAIAAELDRDLDRLGTAPAGGSAAAARYHRATAAVETAVVERVSEHLAPVADGSDALRGRFDRLADEAGSLTVDAPVRSATDRVNVSVDPLEPPAETVTDGPDLEPIAGIDESTLATLDPETRAEVARVLDARGADSVADLTAADLLTMDGDALLELVEADVIDPAEIDGLDRETVERLANRTDA